MSDWMTSGHRPKKKLDPPAPVVVRIFWTMSGEGRTAMAVLSAHPLGVELRVMDGGELRRSQVHRSEADAEADALATADRLRARGWETADG